MNETNLATLETHLKDLRLCIASYQRHTWVVSGDVEVLLDGSDPSVIRIAFRGTEAAKLFPNKVEAKSFWGRFKRSLSNWRDVRRNLRFYPLKTHVCGRVHAGFYKGALNAVEERLKYLPRELPLVVTGHSLGGGMAIPAAQMLQEYGYTINRVVCFGCPRIYHGRSAKRVAKQLDITLYRNDNDFVTTVPSEFLGYHHPVEEFQLGDGSQSRSWAPHADSRYLTALKDLRARLKGAN